MNLIMDAFRNSILVVCLEYFEYNGNDEDAAVDAGCMRHFFGRTSIGSPRRFVIVLLQFGSTYVRVNGVNGSHRKLQKSQR